MVTRFVCLVENIFGNFLETGQYISRSHKLEDIQSTNKNTYNMVMVDITTSFTILIGIFFPSVTGKRSVRRVRNDRPKNFVLV